MRGVALGQRPLYIQLLSRNFSCGAFPWAAVLQKKALLLHAFTAVETGVCVSRARLWEQIRFTMWAQPYVGAATIMLDDLLVYHQYPLVNKIKLLG